MVTVTMSYMSSFAAKGQFIKVLFFNNLKDGLVLAGTKLEVGFTHFPFSWTFVVALPPNARASEFPQGGKEVSKLFARLCFLRRLSSC